MKKIVTFIFLFSLTFQVEATHLSKKEIRIAVVSDIHFLAPSLAKEGSALRRYEIATKRGVAELHEVFRQVLDSIIDYNPDFLFIPGDLTSHGAKVSHLSLIEELRVVADKGIRIFVVPGNHDVNIPNAKGYADDRSYPVESVSMDEFANLYRDFGYGSALFRDTSSLSYVAELNDDIWLLSLDSNRYKEYTSNSISSGRLTADTFDWALEMIKLSKSRGKTILGMMHHGVVEHFPMQSFFFPAYIISNWQDRAERLADAGLKIIFTGHFHANDITRYVSKKGNEIYDIETGSLISYPFPFRKINIKGDVMDISSSFITSTKKCPNLEAVYKERLQTESYSIAKNKLSRFMPTIDKATLESLSIIVSKIAVLHAKGDEIADDELKALLSDFKKLTEDIGDSVNEEFELELFPADNFVKINLR